MTSSSKILYRTKGGIGLLYVLLTIIAVGVLLLSEPGRALLSFFIGLGIIAALLFVVVVGSIMLYGLAKPYFTKTPTNKVAQQGNLNTQWEQSKPVVPSVARNEENIQWDKIPPSQTDPVVPPVRLIDNRNGTVTDSQTHLMWQQGENERMSWDRANNFCEGLTLATYTDWRLPDKEELLTLIDKTQNRDPVIRINKKQFIINGEEAIVEAKIPVILPAINMKLFPNATADTYWSSTPHAYNEPTTWFVNFLDGYINYGWRDYRHYVRCVRLGSLPKYEPFDPNKDY